MRAAIDNLLEIYVLSRDELLNEVLNGKGIGTKVFANTLLRSLQKQIKKLKKASSEYIKAEIPKAYRKALKELYSEYANALRMEKPNLFATIHTEAIETAAREMQYQISSGLEQAGRRAQRYINIAKDEALRTEGLKATGVKFGSGQTLEAMKESLKSSLSGQGFLSVQYGSGPNAYQVGLDSYVNMVARTTTKEVGNLARVNGLIETGHDLVKMTEHYPTCSLCATLQGRVYSISGKDKRFPPLSKAFTNGYKTVHPNCRHIVTPWIESLQSPEEIKEASAFSSRPFEDSRDKKEIDLYNSQQAKSREYRETLGAYERYKSRLGSEAPQTHKEFVKVKNDPEQWKQLQRKYAVKPIKDAISVEHPDLKLGDFEVIKGIDTRKDVEEFLTSRSAQERGYFTDFASFQKFKYNTGDHTYKLFSGYSRAVDLGDILPLINFETYEQVASEVEKELIGLVTSDGMKITDYKTHFIDRIIGQHHAGDPGIPGLRKGVSIEDAKDALLNSIMTPLHRTDDKGRSSKKYESEVCVVTLNDLGELIQTNPKRRKGE